MHIHTAGMSDLDDAARRVGPAHGWLQERAWRRGPPAHRRRTARRQRQWGGGGGRRSGCRRAHSGRKVPDTDAPVIGTAGKAALDVWIPTEAPPASAEYTGGVS